MDNELNEPLSKMQVFSLLAGGLHIRYQTISPLHVMSINMCGMLVFA
jgi:hypothetical protein